MIAIKQWSRDIAYITLDENHETFITPVVHPVVHLVTPRHTYFFKFCSL